MGGEGSETIALMLNKSQNQGHLGVSSTQGGGYGYGFNGSTSGGGGFNNHNHNNRGFKSRNNLDRSNLFCDYCKFTGHTKEMCYKLHGYPANYKFKKKGGGMSTHANSVYANNAINSGCEAPDEAGHSSQTSAQPNTLVSLNVTASCNSVVPYFTPEQHSQLLHILNKGKWKDTDAMVNFAKAGSTGYQVEITHKGEALILQNRVIQNVEISSGKVIGIGREERGVYILKANNLSDEYIRSTLFRNKADIIRQLMLSQQQFSSNHVQARTNVANNQMPSNGTLWHRRLRHAPMKVLKSIDDFQNVQFTDHICTVCPIAKQSRLPFPTSSIVSSCVFDLIHADNGVVERIHRSILDMARALGFQATIPLNSLPFFSCHGISPFERLYKRSPFLKHLRVFGCLCYAFVPKKHSKFSPRAVPTVHLGYYSSQKGYVLYDLCSKMFFVSRDTIFQEEIYPFKHVSDLPSHIFLVLQLSESEDFIPSASSSDTYNASTSTANDYHVSPKVSTPSSDINFTPDLEHEELVLFSAPIVLLI
ncbi:uncharacterized protein LOC124889004 [Capsicum annuum]|uniref:uncharacterized protein LOC124889004 n=1 Tax=Capsicum annuum TaxID=4072 RepID=UPI001FB19E81|nr:uncharacterized protein LOC124889004 [Capsicum annuum]